MVISSINGEYDWAEEVKQIDESKAGVKGLVDSGITKLPTIFLQPEAAQATHLPPAADGSPPLDLPTIDFSHLQRGGDGRRATVEEIRKAANEWGFFRIINHAIPLDTMDATLAAVKRFHKLPNDEKAPFYSTDSRRKVRFQSNLPEREDELCCWRDILSMLFLDDQLDPDEIPTACRDQMHEYMGYVVELRELVAELLSEALGLPGDYLSKMECMKSQGLACLYYPKCPEPEKTFGNKPHTDATLLTLLIQDAMGGLQVRHRGLWVDVAPVRGALVANIGDLMQLISNDKFISVEHRVVAQEVEARVSVACFFTPSTRGAGKLFAPIKELLSDENPAVYREVMFGEYMQVYKSKFRGATSPLPQFKIHP